MVQSFRNRQNFKSGQRIIIIGIWSDFSVLREQDFLHKIVPAAKHVGAFFKESAAPENAEVDSCKRKVVTVKRGEKSEAETTKRASWPHRDKFTNTLLL